MVIFIYGEDSFRSRLRLTDYKNRFFEKYGSQSDYSVIDAADKGSVKLKDAAETGSLFSSVKLLVVKNLLQNSLKEEQEKVVEFFNSRKQVLSDKKTVIVFWESGVPGKTSVLFSYLKKGSRCEAFEKLDGTKLTAWISSRLKEINPGVKISRLASEKLAAYSAGGTELINSELLKLASYKDKGEITDEDVDVLVSAKLFSDIFATVGSASGGNKKAAISLFHRQLENKADPFYILLMYVYQFRCLLTVGGHYWQGEKDKFSISRKTGLHPYVVQKSLEQLRNFSLSRLKKIYARLGKIDLEAKTGKIALELALDQFLIEI